MSFDVTCLDHAWGIEVEMTSDGIALNRMLEFLPDTACIETSMASADGACLQCPVAVLLDSIEFGIEMGGGLNRCSGKSNI